MYYRSSCKNGGVGIFCRNELGEYVTEIDVSKSVTERTFEICGIELKTYKQKVHIFCLYRTPSSDFKNFIEVFSSFLEYNYNIVGEATRVSQKSATAIDYVCLNVEQSDYSQSVIFNGISDHSCQLLTLHRCIKLSPGICENKYSRSFSKTNYNNFNNSMQKENWEDVYATKDVNEGFKTFLNIFQYYVDDSFPLKKVQTGKRHNKPWLTQGIRISGQRLKDLHFLLRQGYVSDKYYTCYKKTYRKTVVAAKKLYNDNLYKNSSNKSKAAWYIINKSSNQSSRQKIESLKLSENNILVDRESIANEFNSYFVNMPYSLMEDKNVRGQTNDYGFKSNKISDTMFLRPTTEIDIFNIILSLKTSNSMGFDNTSNNLIKAASHFVVHPLTYLINMSLVEGIFPDCLKIAKVVPIFKNGNKQQVSNYRPISILSSISKVVERVIFDKIVDFLNINKVLTDNQHGFRKNRSTQTAILQFLTKLNEEIDNGHKCTALFMDLSKAFDMVSHDLLQSKLYNYGLRGKVKDLITSFLSSRKQVVDVDGAHSGALEIKVGVPQGSILGPLIFLIFVNDLSYVTDDLVMYADDNTFQCHGKTHNECVQKLKMMIDKVILWFSSNQLCLNTSKTVFMNFTPRVSDRQESFLVTVNNKSIQQVDTVKFLGLHLDNSLNYASHVNSLCSNLSSVCYVVKRLMETCNRNIVLAFYYGQFVSRVKYGIIFWGSSSLISRIFITQKRIIRSIAGASSRTSCRQLFQKYKVLTVPCIYMLELLLYVKKNVSSFPKNSDFHKYNTRNCSALTVPAHKLTIYEKSPNYIGLKLYNKIDPSIRDVTSLNNFKLKLKEFFVNKCFYSVTEFLESEQC
nr:unnamed protein product [Callosobruchus chinensis]